MQDDAFYTRDGERFVSSPLCRGPWDPGAQHGGPPSALLATTVEQRHPRPELMIARVTVEIPRPVPIAPLTIATRVIRSGRGTDLVEAILSAEAGEVMRATVLRIRTTALALERAAEPPPPRPPGPVETRFFPTGQKVGYHTAVEIAFTAGGFLELGPATVWMRMRVPLIAGEPIHPVARVLVPADAGNGVSNVLDYRSWVFVNPEITVHLHRLPAGEWVCLDARTTVEPEGVGLAESRLFDETGPIGRGAQALYITARGPADAGLPPGGPRSG